MAELDRSPALAEHRLLSALARNSFDAESLIALGLLAESRSDYRQAEHYLTQATVMSRRFRPRWALAYYYARRGDSSHFWKAAVQAGHTVGADVRPLYRLARAMAVDENADARTALGLQSQPELAAYLQVVLEEGREEEVCAIGDLLESSPQNRAILQSAAEQLIHQGHLTSGLAFCNRIAPDQDRIDAASGRSLINGRFDFHRQRTWDWKLYDVGGVDVVKHAGLKLEFHGTQPDSAVLIEQIVPVLPQRDYRFRCVYGTANVRSPSGLRWQVLPLEGNSPLASSSFIGEGQPESGVLSFRPDQPFVRLSLVYARVFGTVRQQGVLTLQSADLELIP